MSPPRAKRILLVEDDFSVRESLEEVLADEGYEVETALNGVEGILALDQREQLPDVVLLDLMMPIADGRDFLALARADGRLADLRIVVITAQRRDLPKGIPVIRKPFDASELLACLERIFDGGE